MYKKKSLQNISLAIFLILSTGCGNGFLSDHEKYSGWAVYGGTKDNIRYSSLDEINLQNVAELQRIWSYSSGDADTAGRSQIQTNPIIVNGVLYGLSPRLKLFALQASTGKQLWVFDPAILDTAKGRQTSFQINRGVVYWEDGDDKRIIYSIGAKTIAVNAVNGVLIKDFGNNGSIDLSKELDREDGGFNPYVVSTTPGVVYKDLLIMGTRVAETADAAPGHIRAYDIKTGKRKWIFHTIPHPGEFGYDTWPDKNAWKRLGGANCWAGMALDEKRGIVYVPTGSVAGDFYGGIRKGTNLFGNSLIALDAATGKYLWHYQTVHHDLWDRDLPAPPNLVTVNHNGKKIDAVAQITKQGYVFVLDRENGKPLFEIEERKVAVQGLPGEEPWPTQPVPLLPEPFARQSFTRDDVFGVTTESHQELLKKFDKIKYNGMFIPPAKEGSWIFPGFDGGGEWGGAAFDPFSSFLYVFSSELPWSLTMIDVPKNSGVSGTLKSIGKDIYNTYCLSCHQPDLKGAGESYPDLTNVGLRLKEKEIIAVIRNGRNMMPAFKQLSDDQVATLMAFLLNKEEKEPGAIEGNAEPVAKSILDEVPYVMTGYNRFLDKNGYPGIKPPWGTLNAINLNTGKLEWKVPVGEYPELTKKGIPVTGTEGYGGPLVTKGGLVFIAASKDSKIRAFDKATGRQLWQADLPAPGFATPSTYAVDGVQYVVIACGGGKIGSPSGDEYVAFALPSVKK